MEQKKKPLLYRMIWQSIRLCYPKPEIVGPLPEGPCVIVANHTQMHGPIVGEIFLPGRKVIWCAGQMMERKEVPEYAFTDFWSFKPKWVQPFYRLLSHLIAPLSVLIFNNANTIPVYRDKRVITTFRATVEQLCGGAKVLIFPEYNKRYNNILYDFQDRFIDLGRMYRRKTGEELDFVPLYIAPKLRKMDFGPPVTFDSAAPAEEERARIKHYLMDQITALAADLPLHTVVPYRNIRKRDYPKNRPVTDAAPAQGEEPKEASL